MNPTKPDPNVAREAGLPQRWPKWKTSRADLVKEDIRLLWDVLKEYCSQVLLLECPSTGGRETYRVVTRTGRSTRVLPRNVLGKGVAQKNKNGSLISKAQSEVMPRGPRTPCLFRDRWWRSTET